MSERKPELIIIAGPNGTQKFISLQQTPWALRLS